MPWSDWTGDICTACFVWLVGRHHCAYTLYIGVKGGFSRLWGEGKIGKEIICMVMNVNSNSGGEHAVVYAKFEIYYCIHQT